MGVSIPILKFGGVTLQGLQRFGPDEDRLVDECRRQATPNEIYRLLAQRRNMARAQRLRTMVRELIQPITQGGEIPVIVASAFDWATDKLEQLGAHFSASPHPREYARLLMSGEQRAAAALSMCLQDHAIEARSMTGREAGIVTDKRPVDALIERVDMGYVRELLDRKIVPVVAGFQGYYWNDAEERNEVSILGRGGSNLTAVALADALEQPACVMFTNVDGVYDKDPNTNSDAVKYDRIAASELLSWEPFPQVIQKEALEYAVECGIDIWIRDSFHAQVPGTLIVAKE